MARAMRSCLISMMVQCRIVRYKVVAIGGSNPRDVAVDP